jgi:type IV pilus assembly protein PilY1
MLGETWSDPRIFRIPNNGAGDSNIADDIYVAAIGGGFGTQFEGVGSNLTIIDLEDFTNPGRLYEGVSKYNNKVLSSTANVLEIVDLEPGNIVNSTPASPVLVTADTARGINFSGGLLYISDLEGKITKFNLTNMTDDGAGNTINMFDSTTLFTAGSTTSNGRYMYHSMDATIGQSTNSIWLFAGTGDYERINDTTPGVSNYLIGIKDPDYPLFKHVAVPTLADDITKCKNTTNDKRGAQCPKNADRGWYVVLDKFQKVTAEPTAYKGMAYFPIYEPTTSVNKCSLGSAFVCARDDECGTDFTIQLGTNTGANKSKKCLYVGKGILSKLVVFADRLFANIAGSSTNKNNPNLVTLQAGQGSITTYRSSWRHNY